ncbi:metal dependent phosphohydrolase, putative [Entamoeba histolytica HM-1:IMSS-B]|uniref:5'-deoxynucleotidase n=8 Tax=Entamoeba TaxID=5758 RepID=C4LZN2_ENTH1|nr:metal dependent phosphohydrolase, putative [Entamoeba nuttalli P19]XP_649896.1 metal dependent phosphohydrolase, putative [Entamoeba histolytica HM-1:IMSS]EMD44127.1 metal dependent phosphohydrolase, putative [Entamoeba histolytica KU27]EMH74999.1 metal dependent phosphohydrolase, putative [Entamoeba histolytica HM-1:IMSS-B]EMS17232.1 metal dependent phosphohydrolase [Entamoeba histolytica HM-3:IMSS]ENY62133.1 metal dependent phosphohydrolase, putative [Entamoeba histolytica HM-1:IMSS-A]GA|eukprot:XP_008855765.1 metal dependent phosphohydrolase, putative [Entamoeba nuttalli P19]
MENIMKFLHLMNDLKHIPRTGWVYNNVPNPESISDHMYRMAILAMIFCPSHLDRNHAIMVSLCHDMAEALIGDITPNDPVTPEEKHKRELNAITEMSKLLPNEIGEEIKNCWIEFEEKKTEVAQFCAQLDKIEMCIQADEYEKKFGLDLHQFFTSMPEKPISTVKPLCEELMKERKQTK